MSDLDDIATAMARQLDSINGLTGLDAWPDSVDPPVAIVTGPGSGSYELAFGGEAAEYFFDITVILDIPALRGMPTAQQEMRPYLSRRGPKSIAATLYADGRLGGLVDALWVTGFQTAWQMDVNDNPNRFMATVTVKVRTPC